MAAPADQASATERDEDASPVTTDESMCSSVAGYASPSERTQ
ncbi:hypothetical protein [Streptomyces sp. NPDC057909]